VVSHAIDLGVPKKPPYISHTSLRNSYGPGSRAETVHMLVVSMVVSTSVIDSQVLLDSDLHLHWCHNAGARQAKVLHL